MDVRIRFLLRIIDERAGVMRMSSKEMGGLLGLSETRLMRLFHAEVGTTLRRHLRGVRMAHAADMLSNYVLPIKTIASRYGYTAVSNFYRDFKAVHGTSPVQMRYLQMRRELAQNGPIVPFDAAVNENVLGM